jgi:hypothetical protein
MRNCLTFGQLRRFKKVWKKEDLIKLIKLHKDEPIENNWEKSTKDSLLFYIWDSDYRLQL